jgi:hypothetical protein
MRNRKVATATGVKPSRIASLTTTKELPQKTIRQDINKTSALPIVLAPIFSTSFHSLEIQLFNA